VKSLAEKRGRSNDRTGATREQAGTIRTRSPVLRPRFFGRSIAPLRSRRRMAAITSSGMLQEMFGTQMEKGRSMTQDVRTAVDFVNRTQNHRSRPRRCERGLLAG
jgi:hypothetical protein